MTYGDEAPDGPPLEPPAAPPTEARAPRSPASASRPPTRRRRPSRYVRSRTTAVAVAVAAFLGGVLGLAATSTAEGSHSAAGGTSQTDTPSVDRPTDPFATDNGGFDGRSAVPADPFNSSTSGATTQTSGS